MKTSEIFAIAGLAAVAAFTTLPVAAQTMSAPIVIKSSSSAPKPAWLKAEVIHVDLNSMVVRERANGMMIHTFTYSPQVQAQMQRVIDQGGYQYGDKVKILCQQGQTIALRVHGKPSRPL
jgi:hypothetical protein